jgi:hypothetical protein
VCKFNDRKSDSSPLHAPEPAPAPTAGCAEAGSPEAEDAEDAEVSAVAEVAVAVGAGELRESLHAWASASVPVVRGLGFRDSGSEV